MAELEGRFGGLTASGLTRVGIGVATGADAVLVSSERNVAEDDRLIPLVTARDITTGKLVWAGRFLLNPWTEDGQLVDLSAYPLLAARLRAHEDRLRRRHIVGRHPDRWWRTIDVIRPAVAAARKLLLPDLKNAVFPVLDEGGHYLSHNLYYVVSDEWDLEVLGGLLMSDVAQMFVEAYSVRMANGYIRVTSQYLRRVRVPDPADVVPETAAALASAFRSRDRAAATAAAVAAYGIDDVPDS
jgi:hypothetical protein